MAELKIDVEVLEGLNKTASELSKALEDGSRNIKEKKEEIKEKIDIPTEVTAMRGSGCGSCGSCGACGVTPTPDIEVALVTLVAMLDMEMFLSRS